MATGQQMTTEESEFRTDIGFARTLPNNVLTAVFACPSCKWPIVNSMFTERGKQDDLHDLVFELACGQCKWEGAVLGRDMVDVMIDDWTGYKVHRRA